MMKRPDRQRIPPWLACVMMAAAILTMAGCTVPASAPVPVVGPPASILGWAPGVTRDVPLSAPLTVYFTRPVDHSSMERSWHLTPAVSGHFTWTDTSVAFTPAQRMQAGAYYRLTVGHSARDDRGRPLHNALDVAFSTGDPLKVLSVTPGAGTQDVPLNGLVAVTFNHPMVALAGLNASTPDPAGWNVSLTPQTPGHGSWLGTSTWVFHPDNGLVPSSSYTISVSGAARDAWGEALGHELRWSFRTVAPQVVDTSPRNGERYANPNGPVRITFNQPMDHRSTERAFSLEAGGPVPGSLSWEGNTLVFTPSSTLDPLRTYSVAVAPSARAANGLAALEKELNLVFRVAQPPSVLSTRPGQGSTASTYDAELHFSAPMKQRTLDRRLTVSPPLSSMFTSTYGTTYSINGPFQPSTTYTIRIAAGAQDRFGRVLPNPYTLRFTTAPLPPSVAFSGVPGIYSGIAFSAGQAVEAPVHLVNAPSVHFTLRRITPADAVRSQGQCGGQPPGGATLRDWSEEVPHPLDQPQHLSVPLVDGNGSPLAPGIYWMGARIPPGASNPQGSGQVNVSEPVVVSNASITMKTGVDQTLVWVTSARTGRRLSGVSVQLLDSGGQVLASGQTGARGLHLFSGRFDNLQAAVVDHGAHVAMTLNDWRQQAAARVPSSPMDRFAPPPNGAYAYTDRPIYRPGQRVHFRAVIWRDQDGLYSLYGARKVDVHAGDATGNAFYRAQLTLDRFGSVHGTFRLPPKAPTGPAQLSFSLVGGENVYTSASFNLAEYRKPEFLTSVSTDRASYVQGETVQAAVQVKYLFGAPVTGQRVSWTAYTQNRFTPPPGWETYSFGDQAALEQQAEMEGPGAGGGMFGKQIAQGDGATDQSGRLRIQLPVDLGKNALDQTITVEATLTDVNHQSVSGRVQVSAHRASFSIGLLPEQQFVQGGQRETVDVAAVKDDGSPLRKQPLIASIYRRTYTSVPDFHFMTGFWRQVAHDRLITSQEVTSDGQGRARIAFTPRNGGIYYVAVEGKDGAGRVARSALTVYAGAEGYSDFGQSSSTAITLRPDKASYRVGETAHVLVAAPFDRATALVTLERGTIRSVQVRRLQSNASTVDVPITLADLPNVYVGVTIYHGWRQGSSPDWRSGVANLQVRVAPRQLRIQLSQDRPRYHPGDPITYTIRTTDVQGRPVSAEVSLALVDTAVLALQDESNGDILQALYGERPLGVGTASDGVASIDHLPPGSSGGPACGLGGGGGGPGIATPSSSGVVETQPRGVRHRFADTAYWTGKLVTDTTGSATVHLQLPDNLTTWRLDARGVTGDQRIGRRTLRTLSTQDLVLRPATPRFFLQGDRLQVGTVVNNNLDRPVDTAVSLAASGLTLQTGASTRVTVPAHGERLVLWQVDVPASESARLTFQATPSAGGVQGDAVQLDLPVHPPLTDETVATAGEVYGSTKQLVVVPSEAQSSPGALTVQVSSALTAGLGDAYRIFRPTPYDSNEDIAERVLAAGALRSLPASLTRLPAGEYAGLSAAIDDGAARLVQNQLGDGGWPWYNGPYEVSDRTISADVVEALTVARPQGQLAAGALQRGEQYLRTILPETSPVERVHILSVLGRSGVVERTALESIYADTVQRAQLDPASLADLAWSLDLAGRHGAARALVALLDSRVMVSATGAHWEGGLDGGLEAGQPAVTTTTRVLAALLRLAPSDALVPAAARWLMLARQGEVWGCSYETAHALAALGAYARAAHEGKADYRYRVLVDGRPALAGQYASTASDRAVSVDVPVSALHRGTQSALLVRRAAVNGTMGTGPMYYVARLRYFLSAGSIRPRNEGVAISRRYLSLAGQPIGEIAAGSVVKVELTIRTDQTLEYLHVDDPVPAGLEPIDQSLKTSRQGRFPARGPIPFGTQSDLSAYLTHTDLRDDRVSLYATSLPPGRYTYTYLVAATTSGRYGVAPAHADELFFPEVFGRSAGQVFTVR